MRRGTTPVHEFVLPGEWEASDFSVIYITYSQGRRTILEKTIDDVTIDGKTIRVRLTQAETLKFEDGNVRVQIRCKTPDGYAVASEIIITNATEILKEGEI